MLAIVEGAWLVVVGFELLFYWDEFDKDELEWLDSLMLEAEEEDSVLAVV